MLGRTDHIIVLPGGGYEALADHEGEPVAAWLRSLGIGASVFHYPVRTRHPSPLHAVRAEVAIRRSEGARRVGLVGFSAGGHAAAMAALAPGAKADERVDLAIVGYPVISMQLPTHQGSRHALIGSDADDELRKQTSADLLVDAGAPPFFVWHTAEDTSVTPEHSIRLVRALAEAGAPYELHIYQRGRHGIGLGEGFGTAQDWTRACAQWLRALGWGEEGQA
ncbi:prolyl oligopeptidase family serine peptidase [Microbacterium sp. Marseille-Q6648]|uniref:alpha/beta hydrolase n=1 Tax=Microbacterium sp. Marseille-Q6648 TaxID=2937991 RepID=UPI00203E3CC4|nr:prolyl oligopeptidase family serine peptidase [Microbacterium sp. Marseille-Q6648]